MLNWILDILGIFYEPLFMRRAALALLLLSFASSGTGVLVVSRRMAFFPDAAGHTIFAGLALALLFNLSISYAVLAFGVFIGVFIIFLLRHSNLSSDTIIGLVFSGGVALGLALVSRFPQSQTRLTSFFMGDVLTVDDATLVLLMILALVSLLFFVFLYNRLMLSCVTSVNFGKTVFSEYIFGAFLAAVVVLAVQAVGVLLVTALLIAPAAAGRILASSGRAMFWIALSVSLVSGQLGLYLSYQPSINTTTGASVVFIAILIFGLSVLAKKVWGHWQNK
ncbi:MAG: metal ABC transporter permease [Deltaproteobacteria bacterium]|nr:metal ABC transporter permease [Deltaproteobacteria bacterium]